MHYLAIDIGASSGRHIVGWMENGDIRTEEVYRFPNGAEQVDGHLTWNIAELFKQVKEGIRQAFLRYPSIQSLSIDTWGVDYVLMQGDKEVLPCYAYRDSRTENVIPAVHEKIPFSELYRRTGVQFQPFNSIYQLSSDLAVGRLESVTDFLMMPEYLLYKLTGIKAKEFTNATTTGLIRAGTGRFDQQIVEALGLPELIFPQLRQPGTVIGALSESVAQEVGGQTTVVLCATHDTGSAVEGIPMEGEQLYLSSGTWSLLGVKTEKPLTDDASCAVNYSNEGGVGYNRYQKNIMGLWLIQSLQKELCPQKSFSEIVREAEASEFQTLVDADSPAFLSPVSMKAAFDAALTEKPKNNADYFRCACRSLAQSYAKAICELENNTGKHYEKLYIVGGGAKNQFLNRLTEEATGKKVVALPIEATALGNLKVQMEVQYDEI